MFVKKIFILVFVHIFLLTWSAHAENIIVGHNDNYKEIQTKLLKASVYINEYEIVNFNSDNKYVLAIAINDMAKSNTSFLDNNWNVNEWIILKDISTPTFLIEAKDLSNSPEWEKNIFISKLYIEINGKYTHGSLSENFGYFDLTSEWKTVQVNNAISEYYSPNEDPSKRIQDILFKYKKEVWWDVFIIRMGILENRIIERIDKIIGTIQSEEDIVRNSDTLYYLERILIEVIVNSMTSSMDKMLLEIDIEIKKED